MAPEGATSEPIPPASGASHTSGGVGNREIKEIVRSASLQKVIDEVLVARRYCVGLVESEIRWERVRWRQAVDQIPGVQVRVCDDEVW